MIVLHWLWIAVLIVLMISVLVAAHEYGHYLFARLFKMGVEEFAIGFGSKQLIIWRRQKYTVVNPETGETEEEETVFSIRPLPLGGFVRIKGMVPEQDGSEVNIPGGFYSKPPLQRFIVLLMGPMFSIFAGIILLIPLFAIVGKYVPDNYPRLGEIGPNSPAAKAGLRKGEKVLSVDGVPVKSYYDMVANIRDKKGQPVTLMTSWDGMTRTVSVQPILDPSPTPVIGPDLEPTGELRIQSKIGVGVNRVKVPLTIGQAFVEAILLPIDSGKKFFGMFAAPKQLTQNLSGPVGIAQATSDASTSWDGIISLAAILSISVGFLNLLPLPPFDGGQMVLALVEMIRSGKRLSIRVQMIANAMGMSVILLLVGTAFYMDLKRNGERATRMKQSSSQNAPAK